MTDLKIRAATAADADAIQELIVAYREEGHLLPRRLEEIREHADRFLVGDAGGKLVACAELAPLSASVAEVRSLVVSRDYRSRGLAGRLVAGLRACAQAVGFERLTAFTHDTRFFLRLGFVPVKHLTVPEKILTDCVSCPLFGHCDQWAMVLPLEVAKRRRRAQQPALVQAHA